MCFPPILLRVSTAVEKQQDHTHLHLNSSTSQSIMEGLQGCVYLHQSLIRKVLHSFPTGQCGRVIFSVEALSSQLPYPQGLGPPCLWIFIQIVNQPWISPVHQASDAVRKQVVPPVVVGPLVNIYRDGGCWFLRLLGLFCGPCRLFTAHMHMARARCVHRVC